MRIISCYQKTDFEGELKQVDGTIVFLNWCEAGTYYPIEQLSVKDTKNCLYKVLKYANPKDYEKIWFINSDANLLRNYEMMANVMGLNGDINVTSMPFYFLWKGFVAEENLNVETKYNAILMSRVPKLSRIKIISKFYRDEKFCYSLIGDNTHIDILRDINILNDGKYFILQDKNTYETTKVNADFQMQNFIINGLNLTKNKFLSEKKWDEDNKWEWFVNDVPIEYFQSCVDIVGESYVGESSIQITEKTVKPLLYKKPFLTISGKGHHEFLKKHGFELYDELFDYEFDDIEEAPKRISAIEKNIETILSMKTKDLVHEIDKLDDKLEHNKNNFWRLKDIYPVETNNNKIHDYIDQFFVEKCNYQEKNDAYEFEIQCC